jgi:FixJ family two-component response regulator
VTRALARDVERNNALEELAEIKQRYGALTPRERQVMAGVIAGKLNKQICYTLDAAERTVKTHRARVMEKMKVRSVADLVRLAERLVEGGVRLESIAWD